MKNTIKNVGRFLMLLVLFSSCQEDDKSLGDLTPPSNLTINYEILGQTEGADSEFPNGDGSGKVVLKAHADNALNYKYFFSDQSSVSTTTGEYTKQFTMTGTHTYTITVVAYGRGGVSSSKAIDVTVFSDFSDEETFNHLTGGTSKTWYWFASKAGHLGVGPNDNNIATNYLPTYYAAAPWEKAGSPDSSCLYENILKFTNDNGVLKYDHDNGGKTFYNNDYTTAPSDQCEPLDVSGQKTVLLAPANSLVAPEHTTGTAMIFSDGGFMGYFIGQSTYEILSITDTEMVVRAVMGNNPSLAWYHIFTTVPQVQGGGQEPDYNVLHWSDEFDVDGAPDASKWTLETGTGQNGWGNNEKQYYREENAVVEGGFLKITAKKENFGGREYTSARMKTENKFEFTYGKIEIRAKLPTGGGTWPALWMLGANYDEQGVGWPASGEIDIMEHVGNNQGVVQSALHYPGHSAGNAVVQSTSLPTASSEFHIYECIWSPNTIRFLIDGTLYHTFQNNGSIPFNHDFFLIFNVAMGGNLGGEIDPAFVQSTMEVDYVKVYKAE